MFNIVIIGAGVIGLSIARAIGEKTNLSVLIIDKEDGIGRGISSRNSEVIHSGIYYDPKSLKTKYCTEGRDLLYDYCKKNNVWTNQCGKLIIGDNYQTSELEALFDNGIKNGIPNMKIINKKEIESIEPKIIADSALFIECTGVLSAHELMSAFYRDSQKSDHDYLFKSRVVGLRQLESGYNIDIENSIGEIEQVTCDWIINAAGLESDFIGQLISNDFPKIKFVKGCYFKLSPRWRGTFKKLIYPLPDKEHGTLGIHLTLDKSGSVKLGPSAHWIEDKKEDYDIDDNLIDLFYNEGKLYIKDLQKNDLSPDYSGIRPKVWIDENSMPDFYINHEEDKGYPGFINLIGIESPGLTASLAIGNNIVEMIN